MSDYVKREDVLDLIAGHTTEHDCPCAQLLATQVNDMAADPVEAAAIRLAEVIGPWIDGPPCSTAFHREGMGPCGECEGRAEMYAALNAYRAAVEAAK